MHAVASAQQQSQQERLAANPMPGTQPVPAIPVWPTPSAAEWSQIQVMAAQVFLLLEHLCSKCHDRLAEQCKPVEAALIHILHHLLVGHILDQELSLEQLCFNGVAPIMMESTQACQQSVFVTRLHAVQQLSDLRRAFLRRIAADSHALKPDSPVQAGRFAMTVSCIWTLLCKHSVPGSKAASVLHTIC